MHSEQFQLHADIEDRHWWFVGRRRILCRLAAEVLPPSPQAMIVDVGCGSGRHSAVGYQGRCQFQCGIRLAQPAHMLKKPHPPLLITAGEKDHIVPAVLNKSNFNKYKASSSVTEFKEFAGRDHFVIGEKGWEEVADYSLAWIEKVA